jgi:sulfite reductase (NADPH) flavoprotein alpha-component
MSYYLSQHRVLAALLCIALYLLLCAWIVYREWHKRQHSARALAALHPAPIGANSWLIAYASQTGNAEQLAWQTARALHTAGIPTRLSSLAQLQTEDLRRCERAIFIVSTYGEGDPPDNASVFARTVMSGVLPLSHLHYAVLALGDREYAHYCGFGRNLDTWLHTQQAQALFPRIEVNNSDAEALANWHHELSHVAGTHDFPDWQAPAYEQWRLVARQHLNPGSAGNPVFHIELAPPRDACPEWQAGDLVQILAPADRNRARDYSIASITADDPADSRVHLLIRQERHTDGSCGIASGWLTQQAELGTAIELRLHPHHRFRLEANATRPLILIGNGTGLAGLRAHLKARAAQPASRNWLIFGERNAAFDSYYRDELVSWQTQGVLTRMDLVFSRDQPQRRYVQDQLLDCAEIVRDWLHNDAAVYVCGSLQGMASGVEAALIEILGNDTVDQLIATGRYRRDVY